MPPIFPNWNTSLAPLGVNVGALGLTLLSPVAPPPATGVAFRPVRLGARSGMKGD